MVPKSLIAMVTERTTGERVFLRMGHCGLEFGWREVWIQQFKVATRVRTYEGQLLLLLQLFQLDNIKLDKSSAQ